MNTVRAKLDFVRKSDSFLRGFAGVFILKMSGNALYPTSVTLVTVLQDLYDQYTALLGDAAYRNPAVIEEKNNAKLLVEAKLRQLCDLVNFITPNNRAALLTTGFNLTSEVKQNHELRPFKKFFAKNLVNKGGVKAQVVRGGGTQSVLFYFAVAVTLADITTWTPCPGSGSSCTLTNQESGSRIFFKATAVGPRNQMYVSDPISIIVL